MFRREDIYNFFLYPIMVAQTGQVCLTSLAQSVTKGIQKQGQQTKNTAKHQIYVQVPISFDTVVTTDCLQFGQTV